MTQHDRPNSLNTLEHQEKPSGPDTGPTSLSACSKSYEFTFSSELALIHHHLEAWLAEEPIHPVKGPEILWDALRYGTLLGGKRIRPLMALVTSRLCGGADETILPTACAIELVHAQSLIHDDLPCMDNDDLRRGQPTLHKAFDESTAVLTGDALLAMAYGWIAQKTVINTPDRVLSTTSISKPSANTVLSLIGEFSRVTSVNGLVNGQFVDIHYEGKPFDAEVLHYIHTYKTGALFTFSVKAGAILANAPDPVLKRLTDLGNALGLAFQIVDDLLDIESTPEALGKTIGKDQAQQKATYPSLLGVDASRLKVKALTDEANSALYDVCKMLKQEPNRPVPDSAVQAWQYIIEFLCHRIH
jgi:geranylgeranyl diphosphate synthase, type II